jgi:hypothetical protein
MISNPFKFVLLGLLVAAGAAGIVLVHKDSDRVWQRLALERRQPEPAVRWREDNRRMQDLLVQMQGDENDRERVMHTELLRARNEVTELEKSAEAAHALKLAQAAAEAAELATNRDPMKGLTRLEYFQNQGSGTPSDAFQTLVWAALKGDDATLQSVVRISATERKKIVGLLASWPEAERVAWPPEKLAALVVTGLVTDVPAVQVLDVTMETDGMKAVLNLRVPEAGNREATERLTMQRGPNGWQALVKAGQVERLLQKLPPAENLPPKK